MIRKISLTFYMLALFSISSYSQWTQTSGPVGVNISMLVAKENTIFAGGYKSTNGGDTWVSLPIGIGSLTVSGNNLFGVSAASIVFSTDDGDTWSILRNNVSAIFAITTSGNAVLAGEDSYYLLRSTNNGINWNGVAPTNVRALGSNGNYVFACAYSTGVYLSSDNGAGFGSVFFPGSRVNCFTTSGNDVYAGTLNTGVLHSTDNGSTWNQTTFNTNRVYGLAAYGTNVFAGTSDSGVFFSSNNGASWTEINEGLGRVGIGALLILNGYIYAGTFGNSVWKRPLSQLTGINPISGQFPDNYFLYQNYPNPFNPSTKIKFDIPANLISQTSNVKLVIYDALGREVSTLVNEALKAGSYEVEWNAVNYPSGVYFYKLTSGDPSTSSGQGFAETKKLILIK